MNVLFVCSKNQWRSPTGEEMYKNDPRLSVRSAGVSQKARRRLSEKDLLWADVVFVMETEHRRRIVSQFPSTARDVDVITLNIPDDYPFMDPDLMDLIRGGVEEFLEDEGDLD